MILSRPEIRKAVPVPHPALAAFNARAEAKGWPFSCLPAEAFEKPELAAVCTLWHDKAKDRVLPARADLSARVMKPWLTNMSLIEHLPGKSAGRYRVRLHGSALARYAGDVTGKFLEEVITPAHLAGYTAIYDLVRETRAPLRVISRYVAPEIAYLTGESFVAPVAHGDGDILILSVTYPKPRAELTAAMRRSSFD
jgi:hypothetical protein